MSSNALKPLLLAAALFTASVGEALPKDGVVYTVNYPLQFFAEAIAGDDLEVIFPAPPDVDPADWTPDADTLLDVGLLRLLVLQARDDRGWTNLFSSSFAARGPCPGNEDQGSPTSARFDPGDQRVHSVRLLRCLAPDAGAPPGAPPRRLEDR